MHTIERVTGIDSPITSAEVRGRDHRVVRLDPPVGPGPVPVEADPGAVGQPADQPPVLEREARRTGRRRPGRPARASPPPRSTRPEPPRRSPPAPRPPARRPRCGLSPVGERRTSSPRQSRSASSGSLLADLVAQSGPPRSRRGSRAAACRSGSADRRARPGPSAVWYARDRSLEYSAAGANVGQHLGRLGGLGPTHARPARCRPDPGSGRSRSTPCARAASTISRAAVIGARPRRARSPGSPARAAPARRTAAPRCAGRAPPGPGSPAAPSAAPGPPRAVPAWRPATRSASSIPSTTAPTWRSLAAVTTRKTSVMASCSETS